MRPSTSALALKMFLPFVTSLFIIKSTVAVYFPPGMILPAVPLKLEGDPYEETSKLPAILRCPGFRRCEILEEDEERINKHLKETRCPLIPICYNRTSTTKKPATTTTLPVNITSTTINTTADPITTINTTADPITTINITADPITTINTTADPITTITTTDPTTITTTTDPITTITTTEDTADVETFIVLAPLSPLYAVLMCPYLRTDLRDKAFVQKHAAVLKSIGCEIPPSESSSETVTAATTVVASDKANVTDTTVVAANGTSAMDQVNGANTTDVTYGTNATAVTNGTDTMIVTNATALTNGTDTMAAANETNATTVVDGNNTTVVPTKADVISETTTDASLEIDEWEKRKRELKMNQGHLKTFDPVY